MDGLPEIGLVLAFGAGVISFFSPCVAPLVPGYLSFISGVTTTGRAAAAHTHSRTRSALQTTGISLIFVLGFTLVFVALGASAALFGGLLDAYRQPLNRVTGVVMIAIGLLMAEVVHIPTLSQEHRLRLDANSLGPSAPLLLGMTFAFGWVPCVGPILEVGEKAKLRAGELLDLILQSLKS